jgi:ATPase subunit of ABC transporter with duplicated ATPase domains
VVLSKEIITDNLKNYMGTILLISHDQIFVEEIGGVENWDIEKLRV